MVPNRRTRSNSHRERHRMLTFGHFALPIAALIAVSLLFVGIKLFFLSPPPPKGSEIASATASQNITPSSNTAVNTNAQTTQPDAPQEGQTPAAVVNNTKTTSASEPLAEPWNPKDNKTADGKTASTNQQQTKTQQMNSSAQQSGAINTKPAQNQNKPADSKPSQQAAKPAAGSDSWTVQVGAFSTAEAAATEVARVKQNGYGAIISPVVDSSGKTFHRVRIAGGVDKGSAQKIADELSGKGFPVLLVPAKQ